MFSKFKFFAMLAVVSIMSAFGVQAATVTCGNVSYTANTADQSTAFCGSGNLNESGSVSFDGESFDLGISDSGAPVPGSPLSWSTDPMSNELGTGLLDWGITLVSDWVGTVLLELKQGSTFALFDVTDSCDFDANVCSGTWSTSGPGRGALNDLSHTRAWFQDGLSVVPLPATGLMLLTALLALIAVRRRASV